MLSSFLLKSENSHETVGGMPTVAEGIDLPALAAACGYPYTVKVHTYDELDVELKRAKTAANSPLLKQNVISVPGEHWAAPLQQHWKISTILCVFYRNFNLSQIKCIAIFTFSPSLPPFIEAFSHFLKTRPIPDIYHFFLIQVTQRIISYRIVTAQWNFPIRPYDHLPKWQHTSVLPILDQLVPIRCRPSSWSKDFFRFSQNDRNFLRQFRMRLTILLYF